MNPKTIRERADHCRAWDRYELDKGPAPEAFSLIGTAIILEGAANDIERLQAELTQWVRQAEDNSGEAQRMSLEVERLRASVERLQIAVETASSNISTLMCGYPDRFPRHAFQGTRDLLNEALGHLPYQPDMLIENVGTSDNMPTAVPSDDCGDAR